MIREADISRRSKTQKRAPPPPTGIASHPREKEDEREKVKEELFPACGWVHCGTQRSVSGKFSPKSLLKKGQYDELSVAEIDTPAFSLINCTYKTSSETLT